MTVASGFVCHFCDKQFVREWAFLEHNCRERQRAGEIKTPIGQLGFMFYQQWLRDQRRLPPSADTFLTSKFYQTFLAFARFTKRVQLPRPEKFIRLMVDRGWPPSLWTTDSVYVEYLEYLDYKLDPLEQVRYSVDTICDICDQKEIDTSQFFSSLSINDIIELVRVRRLSPWLLLSSSKFKIVLTSPSLTIDQRIVLETLIRPDFWALKLEEHQDVVRTVKQITSALGI